MTRLAASRCFDAAGLRPGDVDVVELHDCFSANELITYEALGLCAEGKGPPPFFFTDSLSLKHWNSRLTPPLPGGFNHEFRFLMSPCWLLTCAGPVDASGIELIRPIESH